MAHECVYQARLRLDPVIYAQRPQQKQRRREQYTHQPRRLILLFQPAATKAATVLQSSLQIMKKLKLLAVNHRHSIAINGQHVAFFEPPEHEGLKKALADQRTPRPKQFRFKHNIVTGELALAIDR